MSPHIRTTTASSPFLGNSFSEINSHPRTQQRVGEREPTSFCADQNARFWIVCCEDTEVTQQISAAVAGWNLPDVRSLLMSFKSNQSSINEYRHNLPPTQASAVAQSEYAIFITPPEKPCAQIKISPLNKVCSQRRSPRPAISNYPSTLLTALHNRHGQSPQAWWLQLPTTEVRAKCIQPIACQKAVAQALNQVGIFIRNYRMTLTPTALNNQNKSAAVREMAADKVILAQ